jgi:hypothetical protein
LLLGEGAFAPFRIVPGRILNNATPAPVRWINCLRFSDFAEFIMQVRVRFSIQSSKVW